MGGHPGFIFIKWTERESTYPRLRSMAEHEEHGLGVPKGKKEGPYQAI